LAICFVRFELLGLLNCVFWPYLCPLWFKVLLPPDWLLLAWIICPFMDALVKLLFIRLLLVCSFCFRLCRFFAFCPSFDDVIEPGVFFVF
jgi:hypothetical protein